MSEYPAEQAGLDGTGLTLAQCAKGHGKPRTVSADALYVKGAPILTFALKCLEPLNKSAKKSAGTPPVRSGEVSANMTVHASGSPVDLELCQEALVPLESFDENGEVFRKGGKVTKEQADREQVAATGGEKIAASSGVDLGKAANARRASSQRSESKRTKGQRTPKAPRVDAKGGKGATVAEAEA